jgi:hypothetical protein
VQGQWRRRGFFQLPLARRTVHVDALTGSRTPKLDAKQIILTAQFIQQRLGVFQVASIEVLGEMGRDFCQRRLNLVHLDPESSK